MRIRTFLKPLSFLPAVFLMYVIFTFSGQEGELSSSVSYQASTLIVETADRVLDLDLTDEQVSRYAGRIHVPTRKLAHMTEYFLLAIAVSFPLYVYGLHGILLVLLAGAICVAYACGDEYHQSFVSGRAASLKDVGIDSIGIFVGIIVTRIIGWTGRKTVFRPAKEQSAPRMSRRAQRKMQKRIEAQLTQQMLQAQHDTYDTYGQPNRKDAPQPGVTNAYSKPSSLEYDYGEEYPERSSDELSEDMPLAHLLKPREPKSTAHPRDRRS